MVVFLREKVLHLLLLCHSTCCCWVYEFGDVFLDHQLLTLDGSVGELHSTQSLLADLLPEGSLVIFVHAPGSYMYFSNYISRYVENIARF